VQVEDRGQVRVRFQSGEAVEYARRAVQRQPGLGGGPVEPHAEQAVQVNAVIRVLVSDGDRVHDAIGPVREEPRESRVPEVEHQAVAVPVHCEAAAGAAWLGERAAAAQHGDLPHASRMAERACSSNIRLKEPGFRRAGQSGCQSPIADARSCRCAGDGSTRDLRMRDDLRGRRAS